MPMIGPTAGCALKLAGDPGPIRKQARAAIREMDPDVPMSAPIPLERIVGRTEIAVRLAIGATARRVLIETTRRGLRPVVIGLVAGIGLALLSGSIVTQFLYQVRSADPMTYTMVTVILLTTARCSGQ